MTTPEVILLDSDEDESTIARPDVGATASIMKSTPLDLSSLGIGPVANADTRRASSQAYAQVLKNRQNQNASSFLPPTKRPPTTTATANRIKSKTGVGYTQQVLPLRQSPSIMSGFQKPIHPSVINLDDDEEDNAGRTATTAAPQELDWRDKPENRKSEEKHITSLAELLPPSRIPKAVPDSRLHHYNFEAFDTAQDDPDNDKLPNMKFRCTFGKCHQLIQGNCAFICHLWAHLTTWTDSSEEHDNDHGPSTTPVKREMDSTKKASDLDILSTCSQCLARFHTPYLMQIHYTRAHSRQVQAVDKSTCHICERDVGTAPGALRQHLSIHEKLDAPYNCKKCRYRCTIRLHLVDHFMRTHDNTSSLMCPFCTFTVNIPIYHRKRSFVFAPDFVTHMANHGKDPRVTCEMCACSFSTPGDKARHKRDHTPVQPKWKIKERSPETRSRRKSRLKMLDCKIKTPCNHLGKSSSSNGRCVECLQEEYLKSAVGRRSEIVGNVERMGIDSVHTAINKDRYFSCSCGIETRDNNFAVVHWKKHHHEFKVVMDEPPAYEPTEYCESVDDEEARIFAIDSYYSAPSRQTECQNKSVESKAKTSSANLTTAEKQESLLDISSTPEHTAVWCKSLTTNSLVDHLKKSWIAFKQMEADVGKGSTQNQTYNNSPKSGTPAVDTDSVDAQDLLNDVE